MNKTEITQSINAVFGAETNKVTKSECLSVFNDMVSYADSKVSPDDLLLGSLPVYEHKRGDSEYVGSNGYAQNGLAYKMLITEDTTFNQVAIKTRVSSGTAMVFLKIYKTSATLSAGNDYVPDTDFTLLSETSFEATNVMTEYTIDLPDTVTVLANEKLVIAYSTKSSNDVYIQQWTADTYSDRNLFLLTTSTSYEDIFAQTWYVANTPYWSIPFKLKAKVNYAEKELPKIILPDNITAVVDVEMNLWFDSLVNGIDKGLQSCSDVVVDVICEVGTIKERCFKYEPVTDDIGTHDLIVNVYNLNGTLLQSKSCTLTVINNTEPAAVKNVLMVGDSLIGDNTITETVQGLFDDIGTNVPLFYGFAGTSPANHQGIGGWRFQDYAGAGSTYYKFTVSGVTSVAYGAVYANNGSSFTVREVNITGGTGYIKCSKSGTNNPEASGTLTKSSGTGDATITYSAFVAEAGNPFYNTSTEELDIAYYRTNLGMGTDKFDVVTLQLGINDIFDTDIKSDAEIDAIVNYAKDICTAFLADNAGTKIIIQIPTISGNTKNGWGANYGAAYSSEIFKSSMWKLRQSIIDNFDLSAFDANVSVGIVGHVCDRYYGYALSDVAISTRYSTTEKQHVNAVHPTTSGYQQIADQYFAEILGLIQ